LLELNDETKELFKRKFELELLRDGGKKLIKLVL
jgi:hypothetical protein